MRACLLPESTSEETAREILRSWDPKYVDEGHLTWTFRASERWLLWRLASLTALSRLLHFVIRLPKIMASVLLVHSVYCMLGLCALIRQTARLERPTWQGRDGGLQPTTASKDLRSWGFPSGPVVKNPPANAGDPGSTLDQGTKTPLSPCATTTVL